MLKFCYLTAALLLILINICSPTIIIIGTGPAGIAAAARLLKSNVTDILILEAENRIGGRINSVEFGNAIVDLGAEWCHGEEDNIVYELIRDYNVLRHSDYSQWCYYNGKEVNTSFSEQLFSIIENIYSPDGHKDQQEGISLGEYCTNKYFTAINKLKLNDSEEIKIAQDFLDFFQHYVISSEGSFSWFEPSAESDFRTCPGDLSLNWAGHGFKTILDLLMQKFPNTSTPLPIDDKIVLNKEVKKILWDNNENGVIVKCSDGSWYHGEQLIFTPSLGVLKENHKTMFKPLLPLEKQLAIDRLGIGAVMKVMLLFPKRWWPKDFSVATIVWSSKHRNNDVLRFMKNGRIWVFDSCSLVRTENNPNVLSLWFTGRSIPDIEQMDDVEFREGINFILDTFFGTHYQISYPISFVKTQWHTNPHFRGSYSYQTITSRQTTSNKDLAKPLTNRNGQITLMFAGEATHPHYYSTVHGAIETGYREADRIIKICNVR